jgi:hypothetical protein
MSDSDWTVRQLPSGRRVVEKKLGDLTARISQGERHWTATINRAAREPFETTGELLRTSAPTLAGTKAKASRALHRLAGRNGG